MPVRKLDLPPSLKARLVTYAYDERVSMASIIRTIVADYAEGRLDVTVEQLTEDIGYTSPSEYELALRRAQREGFALADVIRSALDARLPRE